MAHDRSDGDEQQMADSDQPSPASSDTIRPTPQSPFTLASLLDLDEAELSQPLPRVAPAEERWEQLTLGVTAETGEAERAVIRSGSPTDANGAGHDLIPGLDVPGAVEVPVYLAGRALHNLLAAATPHVAPVTGKVRRSSDPPVANFAKAGSAQVLWPKPDTLAGAVAARAVCDGCGMLLTGGQCRTCDTGNTAQGVRHLFRRLTTTLLTSENRGVRTITALVIVPGELTVAHLAGQSRRYFGPAILAVLALLLFTLISMFGSLRPRPDRSIRIGTEQTADVVAGLRDRTPVDLARDEAPGLLRDMASALNFAPVLWLPLAGVLVLALVALLQAPHLGDGEAATVFTTYAMTWFVFWWGVGVPTLLLLLKLGFELTAATAGVQELRYLAAGGVAGVPTGWNPARAIVVSGEFHSLLLALGFAPWVAVAWQRTFARRWGYAVAVGLLISAIPILLLAPFT